MILPAIRGGPHFTSFIVLTSSFSTTKNDNETRKKYLTPLILPFFLLVASPSQSGPHVEALAEIAKLASSTSFCKALIRSENAREVVELMKGE